MKQSVLLLGASGKVGRHSARAFKYAGWDVLLYDRDKKNLLEASQGVDVIVNGMNPPNYHNWKDIVPKITKEVIEAAKESKATVLIPGNVYHFGDEGGVWSEETPARPVSHKGRIRLEMEEAYRLSGVRTIVLRAGNFIDPYGQADVLSQIYLRKVKNGKVILPGRKDVQQAFCYLPDWSRAAVELAQIRQGLSEFEDIPFAGLTLTAEELKLALEAELGRSLEFQEFPWWLFQVTYPFWELAREMIEMRYLWNTSHSLLDARLRTLMPEFEFTPLDAILHSIHSNIIKHEKK